MVKYIKLSKNKGFEIETYKDRSFGIMIGTRFGYDHSGFDIRFSFWWTIGFNFYDNRHKDERE